MPDTPAGAAALAQAFDAVARVHRLMSAHDPESDLGRMGRARAGLVVPVHPWTWRVLAAARSVAKMSGGAFDPVAVASGGRATWCDLVPNSDRRSVRCRRRLRVDLGGIAKGFAVDQAVRTLRRAGLDTGLVNAGGDLRGFGAREWPVHVRDACHPGRLLPIGSFMNRAVATSAPYFSAHRVAGRDTSALMHPGTGSCATGEVSVTVLAPTAMIADALTKVVLFAEPARFEALLRRFRAHAIVQQPEWRASRAI